MKTNSEQNYKEFKCSVCGDPCVIRVFDTCNIAPNFCPYNINHQANWHEKYEYTREMEALDNSIRRKLNSY